MAAMAVLAWVLIGLLLYLGPFVGLCLLARSRLPLTRANPWLCFVVAGGLCVMPLPVVAHALATIVIILLNSDTPGGRTRVIRQSSMALVASWVLAIAIGLTGLANNETLRREYPLVSLASRLDYERRAAATLVSPELSDRVKTSLGESPSITRDYDTYRAKDLRELHLRTNDAFVAAQGFGPARMLRMRRNSWVKLPRRPVPPQPDCSKPGEPRDGVDQPTTALPVAPTPPGNRSLERVHDTSTGDFLDAERFGWVQDREHVAGFEPHAFQYVPQVFDSGSNEKSWRVMRLELISLLRHDVPLAYVTDNLPAMEELQHAPTRPLNEFEARAVEKLRRDEDLVFEQEPDSIRMVGSLRAGDRCTSCHLVPRGTLLGAFTYLLRPMSP